MQERQREILIMLTRRLQWPDLTSKSLVEVGCGAGGNLLEFLRMGFQPNRMMGLELLPERAVEARRVLPQELKIHEGDALQVSIELGSQDIVYQSVVFSSILDDDFQQRLAEHMWSWVRPGGGVLWYDFVYNNPRNSDVRGVPLTRVRELFPDAEMLTRRVTLAPPISRRVCRIHPNIYHVFNAIPWLRTHALCWLQKKI
jgi:SAM-dependent methyltransferase